MIRRLGHRLFGLAAGRDGQTLVEYAFILILIAVVVIVMLKGLGSTVNDTFSTINSALP